MRRRVPSLALAPTLAAHPTTTTPAALAAVDAGADDVLEVDRRDFCRLAATCAAGLAITACGGGKSTIDGNGADATPATSDAPQGAAIDASSIDGRVIDGRVIDPDADDPVDARSIDAATPDARLAAPDAHINPGDPDARVVPDDARPVDARPTPDARPPDAHLPPDARPTPDAAPASTCAPSPVDCGLPSVITISTPKFFSSGNFFVCRDAGGVFAVTAVCTHLGCTVGVSSGLFLCPCHGSEFSFAGAVVRGPASTPLRHYSVCLLGNGHLGVSTGTVVTAATRLDA